MKMTSNGRRHPIEDNLKILKVEYISNHLLDYTKILILSLDDQAIFHKSFKWRQPQNLESGISLDINICGKIYYSTNL